MLIKSPHKPWRKGGGDQDEEHSQKYLTNLSTKMERHIPDKKTIRFVIRTKTKAADIKGTATNKANHTRNVSN